MKRGVIKEIRPYDSAAGAAQNADHLQPGVYLLHQHMSSALAVSYLLSSAHRIKDQITIIEGMRASKIAAALSKQTGIPVSQFTQIIEHPPACARAAELVAARQDRRRLPVPRHLHAAAAR